MQRLDKPRRPRIISQCLPQLTNTGHQYRIPDSDIRPHRCEERLLGYQLAGVCQQATQYLEGLASEGDPLFLAPQTLVHQVEAKGREGKGQ